MTVALVLLPLMCALCVAGYFAVGKLDKFIRENKRNKRIDSHKYRNKK